MFKIEEQWLEKDGTWSKIRHRLYETEKSFNTYWNYHCKDGFGWYVGKKRLLGYQDGKVIREHKY